MVFLAMLLSAVIGFLFGMACKTIIDFKTLNNMRKELNTAKADKVKVIEIKDESSAEQIDYLKPF